VAAQILGLGGIDSTNSALNIGPGPGICAVVGGASVPPAPPIFNLRFLGLCSSTNSGTWWINSTHSALNIGPGPRICAVVGGAGGMGVGAKTYFFAWVGNTQCSHAIPAAYATFVKGPSTLN